MMKNVLTPARGALVAALLVGAGITAEAQLRPALDAGEQATRQAEQAQARINQLDDERSDLARDFRSLIERKDAAEVFVLRQRRGVESQTRELASLEDQLTRVDEITTVMVPMMLDMIEDLDAFISADLPFKLDERKARIDRLRNVMTRDDVVPAEQYRLIIDAYQTELNSGNTIDTWTAEVPINGLPTDVDMFRYGRISLVYLSRDNRHAARWNRDTREWDELGADDREDIKLSIRVAKELVQPTILTGPFQKLSVTAPAPTPTPVLEGLAGEYQSTLQVTENLGIFAEQQEKIIQNQENTIASLEEQIADAPGRSTGMLPVMQDMVDDLEQFIRADLPFRLADRLERIDSLQAALDRADLPISEQYRLIIEAYQDEMGYGSVQETWNEEIDLGAGPTQVKMYRYGRVALVYLSLDRSEAARWNRETGSWEAVSGAMRTDIIKATKIADGVAQQTVLYAPVTKFSAE
ncbi:MAG: DUF3450 domain-containing protein [Hyphomonadaceae bacterium]